MPKIIKTKNISYKKYSTPALYCISALKGLVVYAFGLVICAFMILRSTQSEFFFYAFYIFIGLGAFVSGFTGAKKIVARGIVKGIIASAIYFAVVLLSNILLLKFKVSPFILLLVPFSIIPGAVGGILGQNK